MSTLRIKIVYEDDIRMFKMKKEESSLSKIIQFVKDSHKIEEFRLSFKDDEGDEITIVDDDDLKEALQSSKDKTTKIYVKTSVDKKDDEKEETENLTNNNNNVDQDEQEECGEEDNEESDDEDYETENTNTKCNFRKSCEWLKFLDDISEDEELKKEFITFLTTFILSLQEQQQEQGEQLSGSQLFIQALSLHNKLNKHEIVNKFVTEKLDIMFYQFPHLLNILKQINVEEIPKFIDLIIDFNNNNKNSPRSNNFPMLPPFLFPFLGLFNGKYKCGNGTNDNDNQKTFNPPPFCGLTPSFFGMFNGRGHHGRRGHRGFGHGPHGHPGFGPYGFGHGRRHCSFNGNNKRGGWRKHCGRGFFNSWNNDKTTNGNGNGNGCEKFKKTKDLRADIVDENITLGKDAFVNGNQTLIKTWKMKNVGKKSIPSNCCIQYFGRRFNPMIDGTKFELKNKEININEEFEVSVVVKSPKENGKYVSKWKLVTSEGKKFGQALFVSFVVNDDNINVKMNKKLIKEENKLIKQESKLLKKEEKYQKKQQKVDDKINKKKEKLRNQREKLLQKLQQLEEQSNQLQDKEDKDQNQNKDDEKELIDLNDNDNDVTVEEPQQNNNEEDIVFIDNVENNNNNVEEQVKETVEGDDKDDFAFKTQLEQLKSMGFNDEEQLKKLLSIHNGSIEQVLNVIMY